jgi:hypothetical protein
MGRISHQIQRTIPVPYQVGSLRYVPVPYRTVLHLCSSIRANCPSLKIGSRETGNRVNSTFRRFLVQFLVLTKSFQQQQQQYTSPKETKKSQQQRHDNTTQLRNNTNPSRRTMESLSMTAQKIVDEFAREPMMAKYFQRCHGIAILSAILDFSGQVGKSIIPRRDKKEQHGVSQ